LRCALEHSIDQFAGQANFGLAGFALQQSGCTGACGCTFTGPFQCFSNCSYTAYPGDSTTGCGPQTNPITGLTAATRQGANILVPMLSDHYWQSTPATCTVGSQCPSGICSGGTCARDNVASPLKLGDNDCTNNTELWANGKLPINGALQDMVRYFGDNYTIPGTVGGRSRRSLRLHLRRRRSNFFEHRPRLPLLLQRRSYEISLLL
jgi:hypothetical protein